MHETPSRRLKPSIQLMTRTYAGDRKDMARLLSNLRMFVDLRAPDALLSGYTIVLDGEKPSDRAYGACLSRVLRDRGMPNVHLDYEPLPAAASALFRGTAFARADPQYAYAGYDRQQWSTFYLDRYTSSDVIGVVDADACVYTPLTRSAIFAHDGRILLRAQAAPDNYVMDPRTTQWSWTRLPSKRPHHSTR